MRRRWVMPDCSTVGFNAVKTTCHDWGRRGTDGWRVENSCSGVLVCFWTHTGAGTVCCVCVCVCAQGCMHCHIKSAMAGQVSRSSPKTLWNVNSENKNISQELKLLNWTDLETGRERSQLKSQGLLRAGGSVGEQVPGWKTRRTAGGKTKKRDSYYRAGCRGRLFSPSSLCGRKTTIGGLGESQS